MARATAHLRLIVSPPAAPVLELATQDRTSIVQPLSHFRLRLHWLPASAGSLALWSGSAMLLAIAAALFAFQ